MRSLGTSGLRSDLPFQIKSDNDLLKENIYNILTTRKGERVGNPEFGTDLHKLLFQPNVDQYRDAIKLEVVKSVETQLPLVKVVDLEIFTDIDKGTVTVVALFYSLLTKTNETLVIGDISS